MGNIPCQQWSVFIINIPNMSWNNLALLTWSQAGCNSLITLNEQCRWELGPVELPEITSAFSDAVNSLADRNAEHVHLRTWPVWECGPTPPGDSCRATAPLAGSPSQTVPGTLWICSRDQKSSSACVRAESYSGGMGTSAVFPHSRRSPNVRT